VAGWCRVGIVGCALDSVEVVLVILHKPDGSIINAKVSLSLELNFSLLNTDQGGEVDVSDRVDLANLEVCSVV
jgi:hypothetical protein